MVPGQNWHLQFYHRSSHGGPRALDLGNAYSRIRRAAASSLIAATTMQRRSSQPDLRDPEASICWPVEIRADWRPRRWVSYKMTGWVQIGSMFALRSLGTCAKRLKFLSWKGD